MDNRACNLRASDPVEAEEHPNGRIYCAFGDKGYADRRAEDRWSVVRCESQRADPRPRSGAFDGDLEFDAVTAAPGGEAVVSKCPDDIAPVPKGDRVASLARGSRFDAPVSQHLASAGRRGLPLVRGCERRQDGRRRTSPVAQERQPRRDCRIALDAGADRPSRWTPALRRVDPLVEGSICRSRRCAGGVWLRLVDSRLRDWDSRGLS